MLLTLLKTWVLPPALQLLMMLFAFLLWGRYRFLSRFLLLLAWFSLWLLSLPVVSGRLYVWLERPYLAAYSDTPPLDINVAELVVVLGGGRIDNAPEYRGQDQVSTAFLWRLRYGAKLAREQRLPLLVTGGTVYPDETLSEAALSEAVLREFQLEDILLEGNSHNTWENAQKTAVILAEKNINTVLLVTHAYHMRRSVFAFNEAGVDVIPMATGFVSTNNAGWLDVWQPQARALYDSRVALHEYIGLAFYRLKSMGLN